MKQLLPLATCHLPPAPFSFMVLSALLMSSSLKITNYKLQITKLLLPLATFSFMVVSAANGVSLIFNLYSF